MIKNTLLLFVTAMSCNMLVAQKPVIDTNAIDHWERLGAEQLSPSGNYLAYTIHESSGEDHRYIASTDGKWTRTVEGDYQFSQDDRFIIQSIRDSLFIGPVRAENKKFIETVSYYQLLDVGKNGWLLYQSKNSPGKKMQIYNRSTGRKIIENQVERHWYNQKTGSLVLQKTSPDTADKVNCLYWLDLRSGLRKKIWEGSAVDNLVFDEQGKQIAFNEVENSGSENKYSIWIYHLEMEKAKKIADNHGQDISEQYIIDEGGLSFNNDGNFLLFRLKKRSVEKKDHTAAEINMNIWDYRDERLPLQPEVLAANPERSAFASVINISTGRIVKLEDEHDRIWLHENEFAQRSTHVLTYGTPSGGSMKREHVRTFIWSLETGTKKFLQAMELYHQEPFQLSPGEKFVLFFDPNVKQYYSYDVASQKKQTISISQCSQFNLAGWVDDEHPLIYDDHSDIWKIDLLGIAAPENITKGSAKAGHINFKVVRSNGAPDRYGWLTKVAGTILLLSGIDKETKQENFYALDLTGKKAPQLLTTGDYHVTNCRKSKNGDTWLLRRETASDAPNYFATKDFKLFYQITNFRPQQKYNWLSGELIRWKLNDSTESSGILYKPENFDPTKKYPVIFHYYESKSDGLHTFPEPGLSDGHINIPWFVSRGYLVCTPDIQFSMGYPGTSALHAVETAAQFLKKLPYVDGGRMGLQGPSFGGYETNFIVTHSKLFTAAIESAGASDLISKYSSITSNTCGKITPGGCPLAAGDDVDFYENGQGRMGSTIWDQKERYINESPIFDADQVVTPLMMINNKNDAAVAWTQGVELFTALWRLQKPAWLLQYDNSGHGQDGPDALDYTLRITQFFDHYLMGKPAPKWMTHCNDLFRTTRAGYELDPSARCNKDCKICKKWNEAYAADRIKKVGGDHIIMTSN